MGDRANRTVPDIVLGLEQYHVIGISCGNKFMIAWSKFFFFSKIILHL